MTKKKNKKYPIVKCQLKASSTFLIRTRCKFCASPPSYYYCYPKGLPYKDHDKMKKHTAEDKNYIVFNKEIFNDYYFYSGNFTNYQLKANNYLPHDNFNIASHRKNKLIGAAPWKNKEECLVCKCGKTFWDFDDLFKSQYPEVVNRRAPYAHPNISQFVY